jgi:hypothetical protein
MTALAWIRRRRRSVGEIQKTDLHHGLPRKARWLSIKIEDLARLPKGARVLLLIDDAANDQT